MGCTSSTQKPTDPETSDPPRANPDTKSSLFKVVAEVRCMVYGFVFEDDSQGRYGCRSPALIFALRGDSILYGEALQKYKETNARARNDLSEEIWIDMPKEKFDKFKKIKNLHITWVHPRSDSSRNLISDHLDLRRTGVSYRGMETSAGVVSNVQCITIEFGCRFPGALNVFSVLVRNTPKLRKLAVRIRSDNVNRSNQLLGNMNRMLGTLGTQTTDEDSASVFVWEAGEDEVLAYQSSFIDTY